MALTEDDVVRIARSIIQDELAKAKEKETTEPLSKPDHANQPQKFKKSKKASKSKQPERKPLPKSFDLTIHPRHQEEVGLLVKAWKKTQDQVDKKRKKLELVPKVLVRAARVAHKLAMKERHLRANYRRLRIARQKYSVGSYDGALPLTAGSSSGPTGHSESAVSDTGVDSQAMECGDTSEKAIRGKPHFNQNEATLAVLCNRGAQIQGAHHSFREQIPPCPTKILKREASDQAAKPIPKRRHASAKTPLPLKDQVFPRR